MVGRRSASAAGRQSRDPAELLAQLQLSRELQNPANVLTVAGPASPGRSAGSTDPSGHQLLDEHLAVLVDDPDHRGPVAALHGNPGVKQRIEVALLTDRR